MAFFNWFKKNKNENVELDLNATNSDLEIQEKEVKTSGEISKDDEIQNKSVLQEKHIDLEEVQNFEKDEKENIYESQEDYFKHEVSKENCENLEEKDDYEVSLEKVEDFAESFTKSEVSGGDCDFEEGFKSSESIEISEEKAPKVSFFNKIKQGLSKTRNSILKGVEQVLASFTKIDEELFEELEEALIMADIGVETSLFIISKVKEIVKSEKISDVEQVKAVIVRVITEIMEKDFSEFTLENNSIILVIGVNGVGKTTSIGKLTNFFKSQGKSVILAAADTFRAAAIEQLEVWGERNGVDVIKHQENSDPAAVIFDAIKASKARKSDLLICDTAGRLHNKKNLMEEIKKIYRIIEREYEKSNIEVFLVLDATTGQNALQQAKLFSEIANITGLVLTKLDGTAKGGVIISIKNELNIPVRFVGVGEGALDLRPFNAKEFAMALFQE